MAAAKRRFNVYLRQMIRDYTGDPDLAIHYEDFVGGTWAVSAAQAVNNVRFRRGDKYSFIVTDYGEAEYYAIPEDEDDPSRHEKTISFAKTH